MITAELLMLVGGTSALLLTIYWVRSRQLREKYAVIWISVACVLFILGLFPNLIMSFANTAHLSYAAAVLFVALGAIYLFAFSVSVSLSRQYRRNVRLMQEIATVEMRVREIEQRLSRAQGEGPGESAPAPPPAGNS